MEIVKIDMTIAIELRKTTGKVLSVNQEHVTEVSSRGGRSNIVSSNTVLVTRVLLELANSRQVSFTIRCNDLVVLENQLITIVEGKLHKKNRDFVPELVINHSMSNYFIAFDGIALGYAANFTVPIVVSMVLPFVIGLLSIIYRVLRGDFFFGAIFDGIMTGADVLLTCLLFMIIHFFYLPIKVKKANKKIVGVYRELAHDALNAHA